jgi:hypothetical protein
MTPIPGTAYRHAGEPFAKDDCPGACWCLTCLRERKLTEEIARLRGLIEQVEWAAGPYYCSPKAHLPPGRQTCPWCDALVEQGHRTTCPAFPPGFEAKT